MGTRLSGRRSWAPSGALECLLKKIYKSELLKFQISTNFSIKVNHREFKWKFQFFATFFALSQHWPDECLSDQWKRIWSTCIRILWTWVRKSGHLELCRKKARNSGVENLYWEEWVSVLEMPSGSHVFNNRWKSLPTSYFRKSALQNESEFLSSSL